MRKILFILITLAICQRNFGQTRFASQNSPDITALKKAIAGIKPRTGKEFFPETLSLPCQSSSQERYGFVRVVSNEDGKDKKVWFSNIIDLTTIPKEYFNGRPYYYGGALLQYYNRVIAKSIPDLDSYNQISISEDNKEYKSYTCQQRPMSKNEAIAAYEWDAKRFAFYGAEVYFEGEK